MDKPIVQEQQPSNKIFIKNIETGELLPIDEIDVGGKDSDIEHAKKLAGETLILDPQETPTISIKLKWNARNNFTKEDYPVKGKYSGSAFPQK